MDTNTESPPDLSRVRPSQSNGGVHDAWTRPMYRAACTAVRRRLDEVANAKQAIEAALASGIEGSLRAGEQGERLSAEESLRRVMVKHWPRITKAQASEADMTRYFQLLFMLEDCLEDSHDLRYFDAWNHAFDALSSVRPPRSSESDYGRFLMIYERTLKNRLNEWETHASSASL